MELIILVILLIINGLLSMAEIAVVAAKKPTLQQKAEEGSRGAQIVLRLLDDPNRLFSTIQVGITLVGILSGAVGAVIFAEPVATFFRDLGISTTLSNNLAITIVVILITYVSILVGELVPKRIGLYAPETISILVAQPMDVLATFFGPLVKILSESTSIILTLFRIPAKTESEVSIEEVRAVIKQGVKSGVFKQTEKNIVEKTLNLSEMRVSSIMTARNKVVWIDVDANLDSLKKAVLNNQFTYYPVCKDNLDNVRGIINSDALLAAFIAEKKIDIHDLMYKPLLIPEHLKALQVLELFKKNYIHMGIVIDEYGNVQGLVTIADILEAIVGEVPNGLEAKKEQEIIERNPNSWLIDGMLPIPEFKEHFKIATLPHENDGSFNTIGGFVMRRLGRVPVSGDKFELDAFTYEVVDMDGNRVDKIMLTKNH